MVSSGGDIIQIDGMESSSHSDLSAGDRQEYRDIDMRADDREESNSSSREERKQQQPASRRALKR